MFLGEPLQSKEPLWVDMNQGKLESHAMHVRWEGPLLVITV